MRAPKHIQPVRKNSGLKKRSVTRAPLHIQPVKKQQQWFEKEVGHESSFTHTTGHKKQLWS